MKRIPFPQLLLAFLCPAVTCLAVGLSPSDLRAQRPEQDRPGEPNRGGERGDDFRRGGFGGGGPGGFGGRGGRGDFGGGLAVAVAPGALVVAEEVPVGPAADQARPIGNWSKSLISIKTVG